MLKREISTETLYSYLDALCKAFIIKKVYRYDIHGKKILKTLNKYYLTDLGIAQIKTNNFELNKPFAIENIVLNNLLIKGYHVKSTSKKVSFHIKESYFLFFCFSSLSNSSSLASIVLINSSILCLLES